MTNLYGLGELFFRAYETFGEAVQLTIAAEECNELAAQMMRCLRGRATIGDDDTKDEIADVLIIAHQMRYLAGEQDVDAIVRAKIKRFECRIDGKSFLDKEEE